MSLMCAEIYSGPKVSRQFQFTHSKFVQGNFHLFTAIATAISICSRQFQFTKGNFNLLTAIATAISVCSPQFQFAHSNFIFFTAMLSIFRFAHYLSTMAADSSYQTSIKTQNRKSIFKVDLLYCSQKIISFI